MGDLQRDLPRGYLGWVRELVAQQGRPLARLAAHHGKRGAEGFACVERCIHGFLELPQARTLVGQPDDARQLLGLLLGSVMRGQAAGRALPEADRAPCDPCSEADEAGLLDSIERKADVLAGLHLFPHVQQQAATLLLLDPTTGVEGDLGLSPDERERLRRRCLGNLRHSLAELNGVEGLDEGARCDGAPRAGMPVVLDDTNFEQQIGQGAMLVHFVAEWCKPCQTIEPYLEALAHEKHSVLRVGVLDVESSPRATARHRVRAVPTLLLFRDGRLVDRLVGATSEGRLRTWVRACLAPRDLPAAGDALACRE